jgi:hypothetical protein
VLCLDAVVYQEFIGERESAILNLSGLRQFLRFEPFHTISQKE